MKQFVAPLTAALWLLAAGCDRSSRPIERAVSPQIINGAPLAEELSPQVVRLDLLFSDAPGSGRFHTLCTGTIIGARSVLTAAHCVQSGNNTFVAGTIQTVDGAFDVAGFAVHPNFHVDASLGLLDDAAVIGTAADLPIAPMPILASISPVAGETLTIEGYGVTESGASGSLSVGTMVVSAVDEYQLYAEYGDLSNTCFGDSGGPAIATGELAPPAIAGIISAGARTDCGRGDRATFTKLANPDISAFIASVVPDLLSR